MDCLVLEKTVLEEFSEATEIIMKEFVVNERGLLGKSFITYKVKTLPLNWEVQRRYNEFFALRAILKKQCPGIYVLPFNKPGPTYTN